MKTTKILAIVLLGCTLLTTSCKKNKNTEPIDDLASPTPTVNTTNRQQLIKNLADQVEIHTINATTGGSFYGSKGTKIQISPNAFVTANNQAVTGNITIKMKEALTKKDMIMNNALPVSNGNLLVSGGEVYFTAWQGNQQLKKNPASTGVKFNVPILGAPTSQMQLFYANGTDDLSNTNLNWKLSTTDSTVIDSVYYTYTPSSFGPDSLNWTNCDYFYNDPSPKTNITFNLTGQFDNSNTMVLLSLNGANVVANVWANMNTLTQAFTSYNIPTNKNWTVVAISYIGGNYYYYSAPVTSSANLIVNIPALSPSSITQIDNNLSTLP